MSLNIVNNIKSCYYNYMVMFYLCINYVLPFYDDVIISMQNHSTKLIIGDNDLDMKHIKKRRMIDFIKHLDDNDKLFLEKDTNLLILEYCNAYLDENVPSDYMHYNNQTDSHEPEESQGTRKRQRNDDFYDTDESINCELNKILDVVNLNTDLKNKDD